MSNDHMMGEKVILFNYNRQLYNVKSGKKTEYQQTHSIPITNILSPSYFRGMNFEE